MNKQYFGTKFGPDFCNEKILQVKQLIDSSVSFTMAGMPGVGVTIFLRYLSSNSFAYFIFVDSYFLTSQSKKEFFQLLLKQMGVNNSKGNEKELLEKCHERLRELVKEQEKIVLIFNRFDQLKGIFDSTFFSNLWSLRAINTSRIVIITTSNKPLYEIAPDAINVGHLNLFSKVMYLHPFSREDTKLLINTYLNFKIINDKEVLDKAVMLSGGHYQLLQMLLKSAIINNPLHDHFIKLQLRELYDLLNFTQKKDIQKLALGKSVNKIDPYLLDIGLVVKSDKQYSLFSPLFVDYVNEISPVKLPVKEAKLFKLLKNNIGKTVSKETIFYEIWQDDLDNASDWALNSLIYRLRKNPSFKVNNYHIECNKKVGYTLIKV